MIHVTEKEHQEIMARHRLNEAAPELLEALRVLTYWAELHPIQAMPQSSLALAKLAIAKAEGKGMQNE